MATITVKELSHSRPGNTGIGPNKREERHYLIKKDADFISPTDILNETLPAFPNANDTGGAPSTFLPVVGMKHPHRYSTAPSSINPRGAGEALRLADIVPNWYQGATNEILARLIWQPMPDPEVTRFDYETSLGNEQTRFDINGEPILLNGLPISTDRRVPEQIVRATASYKRIAQEQIFTIVSLMGKLNLKPFMDDLGGTVPVTNPPEGLDCAENPDDPRCNRPIGKWLYGGANIRRVDDFHFDIEYVLIRRAEGWNRVFEPPGQTAQVSGEEVDVTLYRATDWPNLLPFLKNPNGPHY